MALLLFSEILIFMIMLVRGLRVVQDGCKQTRDKQIGLPLRGSPFCYHCHLKDSKPYAFCIRFLDEQLSCNSCYYYNRVHISEVFPVVSTKAVPFKQVFLEFHIFIGEITETYHCKTVLRMVVSTDATSFQSMVGKNKEEKCYGFQSFKPLQ